jgi:hypothetical protein
MGPGGVSPAKVSNEVTKALQESITSLLGKRQNSEEDANANAGQSAKAGKRIRPQPKSKVAILFLCVRCMLTAFYSYSHENLTNLSLLCRFTRLLPYPSMNVH